MYCTVSNRKCLYKKKYRTGYYTYPAFLALIRTESSSSLLLQALFVQQEYLPYVHGVPEQ